MNIEIINAKEFLRRIDLCSKEEAIDYAKKVDKEHSYGIWEVIFQRRDFKDYILETLSHTEALNFALEIDKFSSCTNFWHPILERKDVQKYLLKTLSTLEAIEYAENTNTWRIWAIVTKRKDVQKYLLKTLSATNVLLYAKKVNDFCVWLIVLKRSDITPRKKLLCAQEIACDHESIWEAVLEIKDVQKYLLHTLSPLKAVKYAKQINHWRVWDFIFEKRKNIPLEKAVIIYSQRGKQEGHGRNFDSLKSLGSGVNKMSQYLLETLSFSEAIVFAEKVNYPSIWSTVLLRKDITFKQAITYAQKVMHADVCAAVLKREDVSREEAIIFGRKIDHPKVWETILRSWK